MFRALALSGLLAFGLLGGCASMSARECRSADWQRVGYRDGSQGYSLDRPADHARACSKLGIQVDEARYFAGYAEGLKQYCTPDNALRIGLRGQSYGNVCPPELSTGLNESFARGREIWWQRQYLYEIEDRRQRMEYQLGQARGDDDRRHLRDSLRRLDFEAQRERDRLFMLEHGLRLPPAPF